MNLQKIIEDFSNCKCGKNHNLNIREIAVGSGIIGKTGEILKRNGFDKRLLFVCDENTLKAADGILNALKDFELKMRVYPDLRIAELDESRRIEKLAEGCDGIISVGTGSLNDICRFAAKESKKPLCIFATAPSMDGFASYGAPLISNNYKLTYSAKSPEVIIADSKILAAAPSELKSAGFGDMVAKYVGLIDWRVSHMLTGEYYCEKVADLTLTATDSIMKMCERITDNDEEAAEEVFNSLILTGIGMSFTENSRPASGTEHTLSHYWECSKLVKGELSDLHGKKVGVATLLIMQEYERLCKRKSVKCHKAIYDWDAITAAYKGLETELKKYNEPDTWEESIDTEMVEKNWDKIISIIKEYPSYAEIYEAMKKAGCATTTDEISVSDKLKENGLKYHPFMRRRPSLYGIKYLLD